MYKYTGERLREIFARRRCVRTDRDARWQSLLKRVDEFVGRRGRVRGCVLPHREVEISPGGKTKDYRLLRARVHRDRERERERSCTARKGWLRTPSKGSPTFLIKSTPAQTEGGWFLAAYARGKFLLSRAGAAAQMYRRV